MMNEQPTWEEVIKDILEEKNEWIDCEEISKSVLGYLFDLDSKITNRNKNLEEIEKSTLRKKFNEKINKENLEIPELSKDFIIDEKKDKDGKKKGKYWEIEDKGKKYRIYATKTSTDEWQWRIYDWNKSMKKNVKNEDPANTIKRNTKHIECKNGKLGLKSWANVKSKDNFKKNQNKGINNWDISPTLGLYFPTSINNKIKSSIITALKAGKNIIFIGPPGTGKTKIAKNVAQQLSQKNEIIDGFTFTTATADWTTFDTIGGYHPKKEEATSLEFKPGIFLSCFKEDGDLVNKWLVIDEINRADIDKAFGQLFSVLSEDDVELQFTDESGNNKSIRYVSEEGLEEYDENAYYVTQYWRLLATMNTYDKASLYEMSYAFMRRFAFIDVSIPSGEINSDLIDEYLTCWKGLDQDEISDDLKENISDIWKSLNDNGRAIGPAIVEDMLRFLVERESDDLVEALTLYVLPQLEGLVKSKQRNIIEALWKNGRVDKEQLKRVAKERFEIDDEEWGSEE